jgi:hypothetical protein
VWHEGNYLKSFTWVMVPQLQKLTSLIFATIFLVTMKKVKTRPGNVLVIGSSSNRKCIFFFDRNDTIWISVSITQVQNQNPISLRVCYFLNGTADAVKNFSFINDIFGSIKTSKDEDLKMLRSRWDQRGGSNCLLKT